MGMAKLKEDPKGLAPKSGNHLVVIITGCLITTLRDRQGLTQTELAGAAGITSGNISRIEAGRTNPGFTTIIAISRALNLPPHKFMQAFEIASEAVMAKMEEVELIGVGDVLSPADQQELEDLFVRKIVGTVVVDSLKSFLESTPN